MRHMQTYVGGRTCDGGRRLLCLLRHCKGKPRETVKACVILLSDSRLKRLCWTLKDLFGLPQDVAQQPQDGPFKGIKASRLEADAPSALIRLTKFCKITLEKLAYAADLNLLASPKQLVKQVPIPCIRSGRNGARPRSGELNEFASLLAGIARNRLVHLAKRIKNFGSGETYQGDIARHPDPSNNVSLTAQGNRGRLQQCVWCKDVMWQRAL